MNPEFIPQDVLRCEICEVPIPPLFCQLCDVNFCKNCVGEHLLDDSKEHRVVPIKQKWDPTNPMCPKHSTKHCDLYCKQCDCHICALCVSSGDHEQHQKIDIFERKLEVLQKELNELEQSIYPKYQKAAKDVRVCKDELKKNSTKLKTIVNEHGEVWHREIDKIIKNFLSGIDDKESEQYDDFLRKEMEIDIKLKEISQNIISLSEIVKTKNARFVSEYKSMLSEFRQLLPHLNVALPSFTILPINQRKLNDMFGSLCIPTRKVNARPRTLIAGQLSPI